MEFIPQEDIDIPENKANDQEHIQYKKKCEYMDNYIKKPKKLGHMLGIQKLVLQPYYLDVILGFISKYMENLD